MADKTHSGARGMGHRNLEVLVDAMMYKAGPEQRRWLIEQCPAAYNDYVGREVAVVICNPSPRDPDVAPKS